jgi:hypothetical protein
MSHREPAREPADYETKVRAWARIARDVVITVLGAFILIWQTVFAVSTNPLLVGAGLLLLGLPPAFRVDQVLSGFGGGEERNR